MALSTGMSVFTKAASATCIAGAIAFSVLAGSMSASAAPVTCESLGATTIAPGICQIAVIASGTFTAPAGVTHLEALLVAGGSAGAAEYTVGGYSGHGGQVAYVNNVPVNGPVTVVIGSGGIVGGPVPTDTTIVSGAVSGTAPAMPGFSLSDDNGVTASEYVAFENPASTLFPSYPAEPQYAGSGVHGVFYAPGDEPTYPGYTTAGGGTGGAFVNALANTGSGGGGANRIQGDPATDLAGGNGASGVVLFRFAAPEPVAVAAVAALAATGTDSAVAASAAGVLLLGGAVALAATTAKRRRTARA